jgi:hypothetical protein
VHFDCAVHLSFFCILAESEYFVLGLQWIWVLVRFQTRPGARFSRAFPAQVPRTGVIFLSAPFSVPWPPAVLAPGRESSASTVFSLRAVAAWLVASSSRSGVARASRSPGDRLQERAQESGAHQSQPPAQALLCFFCSSVFVHQQFGSSA